ncbi:MAG: dephospho-CoA kinase [Actinobacteria bacterium]|nr:dephospho-CoA kinase [Actinomycetota bacterium]
MLVVGLTGGIGSGKSSVASRLVDRGAVLVDADALVREVQAPGGPAFTPIVERFGRGVVAPDGTLDRQAIADVVFGNTEELAALNAIVHPLVAAGMAERLGELAETDEIVILDIPLLVESSRQSAAQYVIVVDTPEDVAVARLVEHRGFTEADARARMKNQASRRARLDRASFVVDNSGTPADLDAEVARCWAWLQTL